MPGAEGHYSRPFVFLRGFSTRILRRKKVDHKSTGKQPWASLSVSLPPSHHPPTPPSPSLSLSIYLAIYQSRSLARKWSSLWPFPTPTQKNSSRGEQQDVVACGPLLSQQSGRYVPPQCLSSAVVSLPPGLLYPACGTTSKQTIGLRVSIDDPTALTPNVIGNPLPR